MRRGFEMATNTNESLAKRNGYGPMSFPATKTNIEWTPYANMYIYIYIYIYIYKINIYIYIYIYIYIRSEANVSQLC